MAEFDPEQVIREHLRGVWRYLRVIGCDPATADDLTQETFLVFLRKPFDYLGSEPTAAYLRQIARLAYLELARKQAKQAPPAEVDAEGSAR
jgi:RNA polymerase sigma-70 factor (ECF subfamily)